MHAGGSPHGALYMKLLDDAAHFSARLAGKVPFSADCKVLPDFTDLYTEVYGRQQVR